MKPNQKKTRGGPNQAEQRTLWLFMIPSLLMIGIVLMLPLAYAIGLSFTDYNLGAETTSFVGMDNYVELLGEERFWTSLTRTLLIVGSAVTLEFCLGLAIAFGLWKLSYGAQSLLTLFFIPFVITPAVAALFLKWIFMGRFGLLSGALIGIGIFPPDFLGDPAWARLTVVLADAWQFTPFMILTLYAGLNTVDDSLIEAARIDGAGNWAILFRVMLPSLKFLIVFVLAIRFMDAFRFFDTIYVLTAGGPGTATETITMYTYALAFRLLDVGKASALGVISLLVVALVTAVMIALMFRKRKGSVP
ncbi:carbohydrate ABC transporter permease [Paracoccus sp. SCSIO 75233]|uniref:carbohydrate ABC transporter permease n=1 Tax=Paracoccus sp. SCSIO 75233 TaxID=3017782 RepID=UPI0022F0B9E6|nr:sugar ABC transporter permease [Paracoccus sp. SCSIO 75233]WBU52035.1 sugar ABC transporter permease [Paracoccus sp. SCSIO 75233]